MGPVASTVGSLYPRSRVHPTDCNVAAMSFKAFSVAEQM